MKIKDYIKRLFEENNKKLVSSINTSIDTKIEESVPNIESVVTFTPIGTIIAVMGNEAPENYLVCDGAIYNITDYQELAEYFETQFGSKNKFGGDGTTTFAVPDLRGEFLRGTGTNSHTNQGKGATVGKHQDASSTLRMNIEADGSYSVGIPSVSSEYTVFPKSHDGTVPVENTPWKWFWYKSDKTWVDNRENFTTLNIRPTNTSVLYCIATKNIYIDAKYQYSLDEEVVGTWIDGKPIYQKVIVDVMPSAVTDGIIATEEYSVGTTVDKFISINLIYTLNDTYFSIATSCWNSRPNNNSNVNEGAVGIYGCNNNHTNSNHKNMIHIENSNTSLSGQPIYIIIQYTKTAD